MEERTIHINKSEAVKAFKEVLALIDQLLPYQKAYDKIVCDAYLGGNTPDVEKVVRALIDEMGEVNHEEKSLWCWWKKTQEPLNEAHHLEEMIDALHFGLEMLDLFESEVPDISEWSEVYPIHMQINYIQTTHEEAWRSLWEDYDAVVEMCNADTAIDFVIGLIYYMMSWGHSIDAIRQAYFQKNQINQERVKNGY